MNKHIRTPWNFDGRAIYSQTDCEDICIVDTGNKKIDVANAVHIVRCVNSHEALVKALQECLQNTGGGWIATSVIDRARAALFAAGAPQ